MKPLANNLKNKEHKNALKVEHEIEKSPYNPEFVAKIEQGRQDIKEGKGVRIKVEDLWK